LTPWRFGAAVDRVRGGSGVKGSLDSPSGDGCGAQIGVRHCPVKPCQLPYQKLKSRALKTGDDVANVKFSKRDESKPSMEYSWCLLLPNP
jgi:hypothetical protein